MIRNTLKAAAAGVLLLGGAVSAPVLAASLEGRAVTVTNQSEPVLCAEKDNVSIALQAPGVRSFTVEAAHPSYLPMMRGDSFAADWTACSFKNDPVVRSNVKVTTRKTLYEEPAMWVVGWTFPTFWRPAATPVVIAGKRFEGLHLIQVWMIRPMGGEEVLVVYPQDGYWRIRPRAPKDRAATAFGSSFLIGPVTDAGRPVVDLQSLTFDPKAKTFSLHFKTGGFAEVVMSEVSETRHKLTVSMEKAVTDKPFAMLRSMYVTDYNNDAAQIAVRPEDGNGWTEAGIMDFKSARATDVWMGRTAPSRHNTSSPDMILRAFSDKGLVK
ncbi:MAG: hypothetical protein AAFV26_11395 [Pseudomonadota bacterium]